VKNFLMLVLTGFLTTHCMTTGQNFPSKTDWIKVNETKQDDVRMVLGPPYAVGNSGGVLTWTYVFYKYALFGDPHHKEVKFYWNTDQTVKHYSFNSSFPDDTGVGKGSAPRSSDDQPMQGY
jgi:outer membrane protein assembly factor BamE (lipoprotein component of BamABCDE complex)